MNGIPEIYNLTEETPVILAPMAGISDSPYRRLTRRMGSAFSFTEFVSTAGLTRNNAKTHSMFRFHPEERPIVFQIFGNDPETILRGALTAEELGPDAVDLNMGCSVNKVALKGSGAGLLRDPLKAGKIIESLVKNLKVPVSAKIRLGWSAGTRNYLEVSHILQESGASLISVHGRTRDQAYGGKADWEAIGEIAASLRIPVLGNGDITDFQTAEIYKNKYGVAGILIGRAAIGNPWIFSGRRRDEISFPELTGTIRTHLHLMQEFYEEEYALKLFRKHAVKYLRGFPGAGALRDELVREENASVFLEKINALAERVPAAV